MPGLKPYLWNAVQRVFGAPEFKRNLYRFVLRAPGRLLDFGCATGHIADAFQDFEYYGLDLDSQSIDTAKSRFAGHPRMHFLAADSHKRPFEANFFDEIMFAGTVHHLTDELLVSLLKELHFCLKSGGRIHILDPVLQDGDSALQRSMRCLDRGRYARSIPQIRELVSSVHMFEIGPASLYAQHGALIRDCDFAHMELTKRPY